MTIIGSINYINDKAGVCTLGITCYGNSFGLVQVRLNPSSREPVDIQLNPTMARRLAEELLKISNQL